LFWQTRSSRHLGRALSIIGAVAVIALWHIIAAFGRQSRGRDVQTGYHRRHRPATSWLSIHIQQFSPIQNSSCDYSPRFTLAVGVPDHRVASSRSSLMYPLSDLEELKTLILLDVVGAFVA
jgi:hypothetical protein